MYRVFIVTQKVHFVYELGVYETANDFTLESK